MAYEEKNQDLQPLVAYVMSCFEKARTNKQKINARMLDNLYYYRKEYTPDKYAQIKQIGGSEIYIPVANIKCRALKAWLVDIFFPETGEPPFDIEPTPVPELPEDMLLNFQQKLKEDINDIIFKAQQVHQLSNGAFDPSVLSEQIPTLIEKEKEEYRKKVYEFASKLAEQEKRRIYDQFVEGGFFDALTEIILDLAVFPSAIMKACVPRRVRAFDKNRMSIFKVIPTFNRVSPFDIYPSPTASDFSDWVIEVLHLTPQDLASLKNVDGFQEDAIDIILGLYGETGYRIMDGTSNRLSLEGKSDLDYNLIDIYEFWGSIRGSLLKDYIDDIDEDEYYECAVWICDNYVLKAILNPDPLAMKPYCKASFVELPDSFWGLSLIDVIKDLQDGINALARAIINNSALSSGPMIERNIDRIPKEEPKTIVPWRIFDSHDLGMANAPAYRFYQPQLTANALIQVLISYLRMVDELSGVPSYTHAMVNSGGSLRTSSGLSMLMESSAKGLKEVVKSIDVGIIEPSVRRQYFYNLINFYGNTEEVPDLNIKAKGSVTLMNKMAQISKVIQLLQITNNPIDLQLIGLEGRKHMLENIFSGFGVNIPFNPDYSELLQTLQQQILQNPQQVRAGQVAPNQASAIRETSDTLANELRTEQMPTNEGF